jgi:3-hydroxyacyl-CoA dehydrogenase
MKINTVTILGANGTMGSNVAGIFASFGAAEVFVMCRTMEKSIKAVEKAVKSVKCDSLREKLKAVDYSELKNCIEQSDLIFESLAEDIIIKKKLLNEVNKYVKKDCVICSGTSGLSISELSSELSEDVQKRFLGMHMFNPPYNLRLCELIFTNKTETKFSNEIKNYVKDVLNRIIVETTDTPGFLGNRIGFYFINKAIQYAEIYKEQGGIDYIDSILEKFTGRTMPPIMTADFVGLDIHKSIVDYIYANTKDYARENFVLPEYVNTLISEGRLGRKVNQGFYKKEVINGNRIQYVYDIKTNKYRECNKYEFLFVTKIKEAIEMGDYIKAYEYLAESTEAEAHICKEFLFSYVLYSGIMNKEVGKSINALNDVMTYGFNWCSPAGVILCFGGKEKFCEIMSNNIKQMHSVNIDARTVIDSINLEDCNYRRFLKV